MAVNAAHAGEVLAGVYAHDLGPADRESGADILVGWRSKPVDALAIVYKPSVHVIVAANTDVSSDFAAIGLSWKFDLYRNLYLRPGFGLAYTTGKAGLPPVNAPGLSQAEIQRRLHLYNTRIDFGSHAEFEPELALGYQFSPRLAAELSYVHLSNGQILHQGKNQGLDDLGLRLVYGF
jgi:hypothetical protein